MSDEVDRSVLPIRRPPFKGVAATTVDATLASAVRKSVAQVDGGGARKLKAALAEAQAGMGG
jgi:hypothetical protein